MQPCLSLILHEETPIANSKFFTVLIKGPLQDSPFLILRMYDIRVLYTLRYILVHQARNKVEAAAWTPFNSNVFRWGGGGGQLTFYLHLCNYTNFIFKANQPLYLKCFIKIRSLQIVSCKCILSATVMEFCVDRTRYPLYEEH